jgi:hypothetical protein
VNADRVNAERVNADRVTAERVTAGRVRAAAPRRRFRRPPRPLPAGAAGWEPEERLLLRAALDEPPAAVLAAWEELRPGFDVDALTGDAYRLAPLLAWNLQRVGVTAGDDPIVGRLLSVTRRTWVQSQRQLAELADLSAAFAAASVDLAVLKGAALLTAAYPALGLRPMEDIDLLVRPEQVQEAVRVLTGLGYTSAYRASAGHAEGWTRPGSLDVDLHTRPNPWLQQVPGHPGIDRLWDRVAPLELPRGATAPALDPADQVLVVLVHGVRSQTSARLRWIADATWATRSHAVGWTHFEDQCDRLSVSALAVRATELAAQARSEPLVPAETLDALRSHRSSTLDRLTLRALHDPTFPSVARSMVLDLRAIPPEGRRAALATVTARRLGTGSPLAAWGAAVRATPSYVRRRLAR